ncbi:MAG TPA: thiamine pyrophosphate-dependent enzyme [Stellaceae bacterium]|nr:thiamine pyrophosphate-dependent enzyme [Stellaceae bacterium]
MASESGSNSRTAAELLVAVLEAHGVDRVFCVPGESYLTVLDALYGRPIEVVTCRHESGAGFMAVADGKLTGRPGVCLVSRGPGASNAAIAVHTAQQDAAPLVLFIGQIERKDRGRRAFQEVTYERTFVDMAKWVVEIHDPQRIAEETARAFHIASTGAPGPVVVVLPEDMLAERVTAPVQGRRPGLSAVPAQGAVSEAAAMLRRAERPLLVAGGRLSDATGRAALRRAAEHWDVPVAVSFRQQDLFDNDHPLYAGHLGYLLPKHQVAAYSESDLIIAVGTRLGDVTTQGYVVPSAPQPAQRLIHVYDDTAVLGSVFATDLAIATHPAAFLNALAAEPASPVGRSAAWNEKLHRLWADLAAWRPAQAQDGVVFGSVIAALQRRAAVDEVFAIDAGNFSGWLARYFSFRASQRLLGPVSGAMGFGVPAAVAAALRLKRRVICFVGDGGMLMTGNELATAMQHQLPLIIIVANNGSYGTIRLHQEKAFPGRRIATDLANPDFTRLAQAFGATGIKIEREDDIDGSLEAAFAATGPVVIEVRTSLEYISAYTTLSALRGNA